MDLSQAIWHTSTRSSGSGNCVEVAIMSDSVAVRDTKDRHGGTQVYRREAWAAFVAGVKAGDFDL